MTARFATDSGEFVKMSRKFSRVGKSFASVMHLMDACALAIERQ